jgi:DNA-binding NarL/FixJ family response regulator
MTNKIRLMVADDHPMMLQAVVSTLTTFDKRLEIVAEAISIAEAQIMADKHQPDVVLTDLEFPKEEPLDGIDLIQIIRSKNPKIRFVVWTADASDNTLIHAYDAGAMAFATKDSPATELVRAIEAVADGFSHFPARLQIAIRDREKLPAFTPAERRLMPYFAADLASRVIANAITAENKEEARKKNVKADGVIDRTIESQKLKVRQKFGLYNADRLPGKAANWCDAFRVRYEHLKR